MKQWIAKVKYAAWKLGVRIGVVKCAHVWKPVNPYPYRYMQCERCEGVADYTPDMQNILKFKRPIRFSGMRHK